MDEVLTDAHKAANHETWRHIHRVQQLLTGVVRQLLERALQHDQSKLEYPEVGLFAENTARLEHLTFGTPEYQESLRTLAPALAHHFARCRHHPEHFKHGIEDMNLLDVLEMFCDWTASSERQNSGNIRKSIEDAAEKYHIDPQLRRILENTVDAVRTP